MHKLKLAALALLGSTAFVAPALAQEQARNVILLITDGTGPESWNAAT